MQNSLFLDETKVFITLKSHEFLHFMVYFGSSFTIIDSYKGRSHCGVIYDKGKDCIYAFGGESYMKKSEKIATSSLETHHLPDMLAGKCRFGLCWHRQLVYLCGGARFSVETFSPDTETFTHYAIFGVDSRPAELCYAVSYKKGLILISDQSVWKEIDGKWAERGRFDRNSVGFGSNPIVSCGIVFFPGENCIVGLNIETGIEEKYQITGIREIMGGNESYPRITSNCSDIRWPETLHQVRLLWVKSKSPLYQRLSLNILRETCQFLCHPSHLLLQHGPSIYRFHPFTQELTPFFTLPAPCCSSLIENSVFTAPDQVFMSLKPPNSNVCFAVYASESIRKLEHSEARSNAALAYDPNRKYVYIFGGGLSRSTKPWQAKKCEKFSTVTSGFVAMQGMTTAREGFGCCWVAGVVYLCGGVRCSVDTFDPETEEFTNWAVFAGVGRRAENCIAGSDGNEVVILSASHLWIGAKSKWRCTTRKGKSTNNVVFGCCGPVIKDGVMYISDIDGCIGISLRTGCETKYRFPSGFS